MGRSRDLADGKLTELLDVEQSTGHSVQLDHTSTSGYSSVAWAENGTIKAYSAHFGTTDGSGERLQHWVASNAPMTFGTNNTERMRIDSSGRVTMPYQPSFAAYRGSYSLPTQSWTTIVYDNCTLNRGSHYSTSTGRFTAPVAGYYYFEAIGEGGGGQFHTLIAVNGATPSGYADTAQNWTSSNVSRQALVVSLSANDYVFVQHYIDSGKTMTNNRSHFHGWLIG